jgi:exodeoxyribonuclease V beta subunit
MNPSQTIKSFSLAEHELTAGIHLLEASAGTGKTYSITGLIVRLLTEGKNPPPIGKVLVVTFTNAATAEMKDRIAARLADAAEAYGKVWRAAGDDGSRQVDNELLDKAGVTDELLRALLHRQEKAAEVKTAWQLLMAARANIDTAPISTIHSFCQRTLMANAVQTGSVGGRKVLINLTDIIDMCVRDWVVNARHELNAMEDGLADEVMGLANGAMPSRNNGDPLEKRLASRVKLLLDGGKDGVMVPACNVFSLAESLEPIFEIRRIIDLFNVEGRSILQHGKLDAFESVIRECFSGESSDPKKKGALGAIKLPVGLFDCTMPKYTAARIGDDKSASGWTSYLKMGTCVDEAPVPVTKRYWSLWTNRGIHDVLLPIAQKGARYIDGQGNMASFNEAAIPWLNAWYSSEVVRRLTDLYATHEASLSLNAETLVGANVATLAVRQITEQVRRELDRRFAMPSNSTIHELADALARDSSFANQLRASYPVALIDEFQDTDNAQWALFSHIYVPRESQERGTLFLIGDPKQAIYQFRGANVHTYLAAADTSHQRVTLDTNFRSDEPLIVFMNDAMGREGRDFFGNSGIGYIRINAHHTRRRITRDVEGRRDDVKPVHVMTLRASPGGRMPTGKPELKQVVWPAVVRAVLELKRRNVLLHRDANDPGTPVQWKDIAVLVNSNRDGDTVVRALQRKNIPAMRWSGRSVYESREAKELHALLNAIAIGDARSIRSFAACRLGGAAAADLAQWDDDITVDESTVIDSTNESIALKWVRWFATARRGLGTRALGDVLQSLLRRTNALQRLADYEDGERALANLNQLIELVQDYAGVGAYQRDPLVVRDWLHDRITSAAAHTRDTDDVEQGRLDQELNSVAVLTIHKAKGLQFPIVILPTVDIDEAFYRKNGATMLGDVSDDIKTLLAVKPVTVADWNGDTTVATQPPTVLDHSCWQAAVDDEEARERLRLLYVAITRAERHIILMRSSARRGAWKGSDPITYLDLLLARMPVPDVVALDSDARFAAVDEGIREFDDKGLIEQSEHVVDDRERLDPWKDTASSNGTGLERAPNPTLNIDSRWKIGSYSGLQPAKAHGIHPERSAGETDPATAASWRAGLVGMFGGTRVGSFVHKLYEVTDFQTLRLGHEGYDDAFNALRSRVSAEAVRHGFGPGAVDAEALAHDLVHTLNAPLSAVAPRFCLADLARSDRRDEVDFLFASGSIDDQVDARSVLDIICQPGTAGSNGYSPSDAYLRHIRDRVVEGTRAFHGFLTGSIDLVFRHNDRYWIVDYKTNTLHDRRAPLGDIVDAYSSDRLCQAMEEHHYVMQYHLYTVALHRWLKLRLPGYAADEAAAYGQHFGGVIYPFVRGVIAAHHARQQGLTADPACGLFVDRPDFVTVQRLDALLAGTSSQQECA